MLKVFFVVFFLCPEECQSDCVLKIQVIAANARLYTIILSSRRLKTSFRLNQVQRQKMSRSVELSKGETLRMSQS